MLAALGIDVVSAGQKRVLEAVAERLVELEGLALLLQAPGQLVAVLIHEIDLGAGLQRAAQLGLVLAAVPHHLERRFGVRLGVGVHDGAQRLGLRLRLIPHGPEGELGSKAGAGEGGQARGYGQYR